MRNTPRSRWPTGTGATASLTSPAATRGRDDAIRREAARDPRGAGPGAERHGRRPAGLARLSLGHGARPARQAEPPLRAPRLPVSRHHRSEEHTSELQSLMRISYAVFCLKKKNNTTKDESKYNYAHK